MSRIEIVVAGPGEYLDQAGQIWAEATAFRDSRSDIGSLEAARALIEPVARTTQSLLLIAQAQDDEALGMALAVPAGTVRDRRAQLRYLGVRPHAWGSGVGARLLAVLRDTLGGRGILGAELWVYCDNYRAIDLYRRMQWRPTADVRIHPRSGRHEQRYIQQG